jgi:hypothetical protein
MTLSAEADSATPRQAIPSESRAIEQHMEVPPPVRGSVELRIRNVGEPRCAVLLDFAARDMT